MTENEIKLITLIRGAEDPGAALLKAVEIILEEVSQPPPASGE